jgi:hypothetical protein
VTADATTVREASTAGVAVLDTGIDLAHPTSARPCTARTASRPARRPGRPRTRHPWPARSARRTTGPESWALRPQPRCTPSGPRLRWERHLVADHLRHRLGQRYADRHRPQQTTSRSPT